MKTGTRRRPRPSKDRRACRRPPGLVEAGRELADGRTEPSAPQHPGPGCPARRPGSRPAAGRGHTQDGRPLNQDARPVLDEAQAPAQPRPLEEDAGSPPFPCPKDGTRPLTQPRVAENVQTRALLGRELGWNTHLSRTAQRQEVSGPHVPGLLSAPPPAPRPGAWNMLCPRTEPRGPHAGRGPASRGEGRSRGLHAELGASSVEALRG